MADTAFIIRPEVLQTLEEAILRADLQTGRLTLERLAQEYGSGVVIFSVFEPILTSLGERLKKQEVSLAQSYVASMLMDETLKRYETSRPLTQGAPECKGPVVLANIEDDCHPLGRKIVGAFLKMHAWEVRDLGIDIEAKAMVDEAEAIGARVIGVSAMIFSTAKNIEKVRREIDDRGLKNKIKLAVGGAVFRLRPELADQVGADGTAPNAFGADQLIDALWRQTQAQVSA